MTSAIEQGMHEMPHQENFDDDNVYEEKTQANSDGPLLVAFEHVPPLKFLLNLE